MLYSPFPFFSFFLLFLCVFVVKDEHDLALRFLRSKDLSVESVADIAVCLSVLVANKYVDGPSFCLAC